MPTLILGAAKDKGGWMSVKDCEVELPSSDICFDAIRAIYDVPDGGAAGFSFNRAMQITNKAIHDISSAPDWLAKYPKQALIEKLLEIRASIIAAQDTDYLEYGIEEAA